MAGRITPEFKSNLLARVDLVELIHRQVPLKKAGASYSARCPFHDERTPSFIVTPERQTYHCFGCGAHGNAIDFLIEYNHLTYPEAVEELARQAGMEIPHDPGAPLSQGPDIRPLYALLERIARLYQQELRQHSQAARAVAYLKERGLSGKIASAYGLGYAPPGGGFLLDRLCRTEQDRKQLLLAGLLVEQDGRVYDRFRDRVIFPIRDRRGRVIGFGGRILGEGKPKYLNSPETPVFHKGKELYGLYEALSAHRQPQRLLVVEGYMDVIALAQFGIDYAVATLGTATTQDHLRLLLLQSPEVIFCFDGDRAGREAAWKALEVSLPLATGQQEIRFLFLPEGEDPDTLIRQEGREAFEDQIQGSKPLSDFLFEHLAVGINVTSLDGRARLGSLIRPLLARLPQGLLRDLLQDRLSRLVGVPLPLAEAEALTPPGSKATSRDKSANAWRRHPSGPAPRTALTPLRHAIALLIQHPELAPTLRDQGHDWQLMDNPGSHLLRQILLTLEQNPHLNTAALLERWRDEDLHAALRHMADPALLAHIPTEGLQDELIGAIQRLNQEACAARSGALFSRLSPTDWTEEEKTALREVIKQGRTSS